MGQDPDFSAASRREMLLALGIATGAAALTGDAPARAAPVEPSHASVALRGRSLQVVDLTHRLTRAFNYGQQPPRFALEAIDGSGKAAGMKLNRLSLVEHTGTHIDAPSHFDALGPALDAIPIGDLVVPLAIVDLRAKRAANGNAELEPTDIEQWERRHGRLPRGCCLAMWSGFDPLAPSPGRISGMRPPIPGFSPAVAELLAAHRAVKGVAVDSMTIDSGPNIPAYPFHQAWLARGRWGIEGLTNLAAVPPKGAILIVGAPPVEAATGIPIRAIAMF